MVVNTTLLFDGIWWMFCPFSPQKRQLSCCCVGRQTKSPEHADIQYYSRLHRKRGHETLPQDKHAGVIQETKHNLRLHVHLISAVWLNHLRPWMSHFLPPGFTMRRQWTLCFIQSFVQIHGLVWHSQRRSPKVWVTRSRWMIWHLEEMPARRKIGHFLGYPSLGAHMSCGTCRASSAFCRGHTVEFCKFPNQFSEPFQPPVEPARCVRMRRPFEMLLFDLTGTGLPTESRDYTLSGEHKQSVG